MHPYKLRGWGSVGRRRGEGQMTVLKCYCCWQDSRIVDGFYGVGRDDVTVFRRLL
jgi:hypothetical protein